MLASKFLKNLHNYAKCQIFRYLACPSFAFITASILFRKLALSLSRRTAGIFFHASCEQLQCSVLEFSSALHPGYPKPISDVEV